MAEKKGEKTEQELMGLTHEQLIDIVRAARYDEEKVAAKAQRDAEAKSWAAVEMDKQEQLKKLRAGCSHQRQFGDKAFWRVAWSPYIDNIPRGVCQICGDEFTPDHPRYKEMLTNGSVGKATLIYHK